MLKKSWAKSVTGCIGNLFRLRNIIIISEHKIEHYPIGARFQLLGLLGVVVGVCWISYSTGSYMAAKSVLHEKDQKIFIANLENKKMGHEFSLLRRDLLKLNGKPGSDDNTAEYNKFILEQYTKDAQQSEEALTEADPDAVLPESEKVLERIDFLEKRIEDLKNNNRQLVEAIRERTKNKIDDFEEIISMTGLSKDKITRQAQILKKSLDKKSKDTAKGQGGPLVPVDSTMESMGDDEKTLFKDIDRMMLLKDVVDSLPLAAPVTHYQFMSPFGKRIDPFTKRWANHTGLDMAGPEHAHILSTNDGTVTFTGKNGAYGQMVDVDHGLGVTTRYGHLSKITVKEGQKVTKGQLIGIQGSTGRSTGPHLHYEVRYYDRPLNPQNFLQAGKHVLKE